MTIIGSIGYTLEGMSKITTVTNDFIAIIITGLIVIATIGELSLTFWLLI